MASEDKIISSPGDLDNSFDGCITDSTALTSPEASPIKHALTAFSTTTGHYPPQFDGDIDSHSDVNDELDKDAWVTEDEGDDRPESVVKQGTPSQTTKTSPLYPRPRLSATCFSILRPRHIGKGINHPDRFVPPRQYTPTKERLALMKPATKSWQTGGGIVGSDPFAPTPRHSVRLNQFFAVTRYPEPPLRPYGLHGTSVRRIQYALMQALGMASFSIAGVPVTEGIISTTDGRGGRITSGTSAPLYNADVIAPTERSDELALLSSRLALAMDLEQVSKVIKVDHGWTSQGPLPLDDILRSGQQTVWIESQWQTNRPPIAAAKRTKHLPTLPFKVLDAPELKPDYYCSLLAYSTTLRCLAVALDKNVYLWSDRRRPRVPGVIDSMKFASDYKHITTLAFSSETGGKSILAIGRTDGRLTLWDPKERAPRLRVDQPHPISHVSFRPRTARRTSDRDANIEVETEELLIGTENGRVMLYSIEWPDQDQCELWDWTSSMILRTIISANEQQICGIAWSPLGETVAIGSNDNNLFVYDYDKLQRNSLASTRGNFGRAQAARMATPGAAPDAPVVLPGAEKQCFTLNAAVKAIAFAPWQPSLLAASGGSNDRCIHFFHTHSGAKLATINCQAQVTSLIWNRKRKEIAATLGFAQPNHPYRVVVFAWPSCKQLAKIAWPGEERALYGIEYPGGDIQSQQQDCIVIATSDHSIKFHEIWLEGKKGCKQSASHVKSQILNDICSEKLENEMQIR
ncbi:hypothetical protein AMS68_002322 [Peltaster fructicola]|uniref:Uncharacterized protein n=1 Tax=Peltaster fructicola TaxID=286661 RepID=A0A6H0XQ93_9PEZI|nr:hypothetical protein AMS68_002322 [Peltaster fructicola]